MTVHNNKTPNDNDAIGIHGNAIDNGKSDRICIVNGINDNQYRLQEGPARIKYLRSFNNDMYKFIAAYNDILSFVEKGDGNLQVWNVRRIFIHEYPYQNFTNKL